MTKVCTMVLAAAGAVLLLVPQVGAQQVQGVDVTRIGPQVGQSALPVQLRDQHGREQTLSSVAGPKGTMLVFFRSADW